MPFTRQLNPTLVSELNALYTDEGSWWRALVDDKDVFVTIRPNGISAYAYGASVAKIEWNGRLCLTVHRQFLVARKKANGGEYVDLLSNTRKPTEPLTLKSSNDYKDNLDVVKAAARQLNWVERQGENKISRKHNCVLDIEAAFNDSEADSVDNEGAQGRVDIVAVVKSGMLTLTEVKLYANGDLRSRTTPEVCEQLIGYFSWAEGNAAKIVAAYKRVAEYRTALNLTSNGQTVTDLDTTPRLLILGFDRPQQRELGNIKESILKGLKGRIPRFDEAHIRAVGGASNVSVRQLE